MSVLGSAATSSSSGIIKPLLAQPSLTFQDQENTNQRYRFKTINASRTEYHRLQDQRLKMLRTTITRQTRLFATTPALQRGPVQAGKDALKTVDRAVADTLVKGIETGGPSPFSLHLSIIKTSPPFQRD
jgi:hypothetical protein